MYYTGSLFEGRFPSETWTGQRGLFTDWDYLFREMITVLLHEKKIQLGMLNPFAEVFVPTSKNNNGQNTTSTNKTNLKNFVTKDDQRSSKNETQAPLQTREEIYQNDMAEDKKNEENTKNSIQKNHNNHGWKEPKNAIKCQHGKQDKNNFQKHKTTKNRFAMLEEEEIDDDEETSKSDCATKSSYVSSESESDSKGYETDGSLPIEEREEVIDENAENLNHDKVSKSKDDMDEDAKATERLLEFFHEQCYTSELENETLNKLLHTLEREYKQEGCGRKSLKDPYYNNDTKTKYDELQQKNLSLENEVRSLKESILELNNDYDDMTELKDDAEEKLRNLQMYYNRQMVNKENELVTAEQVISLKDERLTKANDQNKVNQKRMQDIIEHSTEQQIVVEILEKSIVSMGQDYEMEYENLKTSYKNDLQEKEMVIKNKIRKVSLLQEELKSIEKEGIEKLTSQELYFHQRIHEMEKENYKQSYNTKIVNHSDYINMINFLNAKEIKYLKKEHEYLRNEHENQIKCIKNNESIEYNLLVDEYNEMVDEVKITLKNSKELEDELKRMTKSRQQTEQTYYKLQKVQEKHEAENAAMCMRIETLIEECTEERAAKIDAETKLSVYKLKQYDLCEECAQTMKVFR